MVAISAVRKANDTLVSRPPGLVSVFVGATKGIGASALRELVKHLKAPKAYVMGRSKANCASQLTELESLNPQATIIFIETDISLLKNVDAVCKDIVSREPKLDLLYMSPGLLAFGGPDYTNEGLDVCFSLSYYARMRFIYNLLPLLNQAPTPRVLSVLAGGQERKLITDDIGLKDNFSLLNVVDQTTTMHTLALEQVAKTNTSISFVHVYPGWVQTDLVGKLFDSKSRLSSNLYRFLSVLARWLFFPIFNLIATSAEESGERQLFHATSPRYTSARTLQSQGRDMDTEVAFECSVPGNGVYRVVATGETVSEAKVLGPLRETHMPEKVWEHTIEVFAEGLAR